MANGLGWPAPIRQQASTAGCAISLPSIGAGATYLPLLVLNCSLTRPMILSWPSRSMRDQVAGAEEAVLGECSLASSRGSR